MTKDVRSDPRFRVSASEPVNVAVCPKPSGKGDETQGELLDLSRGGLRIRVEECLAKGETVHLTVRAPAVDVELRTSGKICWTEPDFRGGWVVGCALHDRIEEETVRDLAARGVLERRIDFRRPVSLAAEAKPELERSFKPVLIVNLSAGGFCAVADDIEVKQDDRLLLKIDSADSDTVTANAPTTKLVQARVAWINETEEGKTFGCNFVTKDGHMLLQTILNEDVASNPLFEMVRRRPSTRWSFVAATVAIIVLVQLLGFCFAS